MKTQRLNPDQIELAASILKKGGIVAFPTETVYGLGGLAFDSKSAVKIFSAKNRPSDNPLIVHISSLGECEKIAREIPCLFYRLAEQFFPGPLTVIVKKNPSLPSTVCGGLDSVAIRMPAHPIAQALISAVGEPLVAPSANRSSCPSGTIASDVLEDFEGKIDAVLDGGPTLHGIESTVLDLVNFKEPTLLRPGIISKEELESFLKREIALYTSGVRASPGMKYRHYAPKAKVFLCKKKETLLHHLLSNQYDRTRIFTPIDLAGCFSKNISIVLLKRETLYAQLRRADREGIKEILILLPYVNDAALSNRLEKMVDGNFYLD